VRIDTERSFVIADIPGIIEGAAEGAGLGLQFLRHLQRTRLLLQLVDLAPMDQKDPAESVRELETELTKYDDDLAGMPRWLVFTKADLLPAGEAEERAREVMDELGWDGEWALISSATGEGTRELVQRVMGALLEMREAEAEAGAASAVMPDETEGETEDGRR
jgi:GTP-binding protein